MAGNTWVQTVGIICGRKPAGGVDIVNFVVAGSDPGIDCRQSGRSFYAQKSSHHKYLQHSETSRADIGEEGGVGALKGIVGYCFVVIVGTQVDDN